MRFLAGYRREWFVNGEGHRPESRMDQIAGQSISEPNQPWLGILPLVEWH